MTTYNTSADAANTAVRSFLTKVGEYYLGRSFNTAVGKGKKNWEEIKKFFDNKCAYCGKETPQLQIEHLIMFNRVGYGLHHPGNIIPCCKECNRRCKDKDGNYFSWEQHLKEICKRNGEGNKFKERLKRILEHMKRGKYKYPRLSEKEISAIRVIAKSLYENIKKEHEKSLDLYKELEMAFLK